MDIQKIINDVLAKLKGDEGLLNSFKADPIKTLEGLLNIDLPDEKLKAVVEGVKAKINLDDLGEKASGVMGFVKNLFGKK